MLHLFMNRGLIRFLRIQISKIPSRGKRKMANTKFEYVKKFEQETPCLEQCWIVVRVDGKGFHRFTDIHGFEKPNDVKGLSLMSRAAACVMDEFRDIVVAYGHSDEYSFIFKKDTQIFNRRNEKILSLVTSLFSSSYVFHWNDYFDKKMIYPPAFDGRVILYPTDEILRDYMSWRQADAHINNLYNTCFWSLVQIKGITPTEAEVRLNGTFSSDKNELLFQEFNINYNNEPELFKKGTTLVRKFVKFPGSKPKLVAIPLYCDIIKDDFWLINDEIIGMKKLPIIEYDEQLTYFRGSIRANVKKEDK